MLDANEWFDEEIEIDEWDGPKMQRRSDRIAYLVYANGGRLSVGGWGMLTGDEYGHRIGLKQDEALELMQHAAYMQGAADAGVDLLNAFSPRFGAYIAKVRDSLDKCATVAEDSPS